MLRKLIRTITTPKSLFAEETQFRGVTKRNRKQQLIIGLDFGTAFTKVVIGESRQAYGVHFSKFGDEQNPYLLPAAMAVDSAGFCSLDLESPKSRRVGDLKMRLLEGDYSLESKAESVAYLALVLQFSRKWLFSKQKRIYGQNYLDWNLNVGLPTHNYHDAKLVQAYRDIVHCAWLVSVTTSSINLEFAKHVLEGKEDASTRQDRLIHPDSIGLFPEFVAQVTGYVRSPQRQEDLHALMDVGAGTVDVTVFNVFHRDDDDFFPIFAKSVKNFGVFFHTKFRLEKLQYKGRWAPNAQDRALTDREFGKKLRVSQQQLADVDRPFRKKVSNQLNEQLRYTKDKRYPKSRRWEEGVPIFLCGGGANVELYANLIESLEEKGKPFKIVRQGLPKPERLKAGRLRAENFDRLSVAYGLSFDAFDIGEIEKAEEIEDITDDPGLPGRTGGTTFCSICHGSGGAMAHGCYKCGGTGLI